MSLHQCFGRCKCLARTAFPSELLYTVQPSTAFAKAGDRTRVLLQCRFVKFLGRRKCLARAAFPPELVYTEQPSSASKKAGDRTRVSSRCRFVNVSGGANVWPEPPFPLISYTLSSPALLLQKQVTERMSYYGGASSSFSGGANA